MNGKMAEEWYHFNKISIIDNASHILSGIVNNFLDEVMKFNRIIESGFYYHGRIFQ